MHVVHNCTNRDSSVQDLCAMILAKTAIHALTQIDSLTRPKKKLVTLSQAKHSCSSAVGPSLRTLRLWKTKFNIHLKGFSICKNIGKINTELLCFNIAKDVHSVFLIQPKNKF